MNGKKKWKMLYDETKKYSQFDHSAVHPLQLSCGVLLSNDEMLFTNRLKAIEYSSSINCVPIMLHKIKQLQHNDNQIKPIILIIMNQFGILHCPDAQSRALFCEHGLGYCLVAFHYHQHIYPNYWYQYGDHHTKFDHSINILEMKNYWPQQYNIYVRSFKELLPAMDLLSDVEDLLNNTHSDSKAIESKL